MSFYLKENETTKSHERIVGEWSLTRKVGIPLFRRRFVDFRKPTKQWTRCDLAQSTRTRRDSGANVAPKATKSAGTCTSRRNERSKAATESAEQ